MGVFFSGLSLQFVVNELIVRFIRDGVLVLSLVIPVVAGMGLNFAIVVGAISAQVGLILAVDYQFSGIPGLCFIGVVGVTLSLIFGYLIGLSLNRAKGKEMIITIIIGFLATSVYQLVFMAGYGTVIHPHNPQMMLSRGIGIRNMIDLEKLRNVTDNLWLIKVAGIEIPLFMVGGVLFFALLVTYLLNTRIGQLFRAVGLSPREAVMLGIDTDRVRILAIVISTVLACCGMIIYSQNIGMLNVYTAHLNSDIFSCAALLAGGASIRKANVRHALIGIFLFHTLFIVSPQAGQNIFHNPALGEYFRTFVAYGTIAFALMGPKAE
jgi:simple sugar transport system permease protein